MDWERIFRHQFTHGCDCFQCRSQYCARCPKFLYRTTRPSELNALIQRYVQAPDRDKYVCPYLPPHIRFPEVRDRLDRLNEWGRRFVDLGHPDPGETAQILTENQDLIPLLFLANDLPLSLRNCAIDDDLFWQFTSKLTLVEPLSAFVDNFLDITLKDLVKNQLYSFSRVRLFLFLIYFPGILARKELLMSVVKILAEPFPLLKETFNQWFAVIPCCMNMALGACRLHVTTFFAGRLGANPHCREVRVVLNAMATLFEANELAAQRVPTSRFYIHHISDRVDIVQEFMKRNDSLLAYPFVFPLEKKAELCQLESEKMMQSMAMRALVTGLKQAIFRREHVELDLFFTIHIRRSHLLEDAMRELSRQREWEFLKKLKVEFEGEVALDVGGPSREFLYLVSEQLLSPEFGMFHTVNGKHLWFMPGSFEDDASFMLVGIVIGLAVYNSVVLPIRFPMCLYKKLLMPDQPLTITDLADIDEDLANSLRSIERMKLADEDVSSLCLDFTVTLDQFGESVKYALRPNGDKIDVTNENCDEYIREYIQFILSASIHRQFRAFALGFHLPIRATSYKFLSPCELDILVSGNDVLEWRQLKKNAKYSDGYTPESRAVVWFWEVFDALSEDDKRKFLKFSTGTDRAPYGGLKNVSLVIQRAVSTGQLPISHTCFNTFCLPDYATKEELEHKVKLAIQYTEGFGIV